MKIKIAVIRVLCWGLCLVPVSLVPVSLVQLGSVHADEPEFIKHTAADRDTFFYVADPLPHLQAAVQSETFTRFADIINGMAPRPMPESQQILAQLKMASAYVPTEMAITTTSDEVGQISNVFHSGLLMLMCEAAIAQDDSASLVSLQTRMAKQLSKLRFDSTDIWLNFRSPIPAAILYGQAIGLVNNWGAEDYVQVDFTDGITVSAAVQNLISTKEVAAEVLKELAIVDDVDTPEAKALAKAFLELKISVRLRQHGNALLLTLGTPVEDGSSSRSPVFEGLIGPDDALVLSSRYRMTEFRVGLEAIQDLWLQWKDKPVGEAVEGWDTDGLLTDLDDVVRALHLAGDEGTLLVRAQDGLQGTLTEVGVPEFQTLQESKVINLLPATSGLVSASSMMSLGIMFSNALSRVEERMATNTLKYELSGRQGRLQMANQMEEFYYQKLSEFRRLVKFDAVECFVAPVATIMDANGKISELAVSFEGAQGRNDLIVEDLKCPRLAMIGRLKAGSDVRKLVGEIWKSFYNGVNQDDFDFDAIVPDTNRLGQQAYFFTSEWQTNLPSQIRFSAIGLEPHYFIIDDKWFVFSTSPDLSQEILTAAADPLQRASVPGQLTAYGHVPLSEFSEVLRNGIDALMRLVADQDGIVLSGVELEQFQQKLQSEQGQRGGLFSAMEIFSSVLEICDSVSWESQVKDKTCTTNFSITFPEF